MTPRHFRFSLLGLALAVLLAPAATSASPPDDFTPWMGTASGKSSLHLGHKSSSKSQSAASRILGSWATLEWAAKNRDRRAIELEVRVDEQRVEITDTGASRSWGGTYAKRGKHGKELRVVYDEASLSALTEYLSERVAAMHRARSLSAHDLDVAVVDYDVKIKVDPKKRRFALKGKVRYAATHDGSDKPDRGRYHFSAKGDAHEVVAVVDEEPAPTRVLLLGDGGSESQVEAALAGAGNAVTTIPSYADWDGVTPDVSDFDVVVYLDGFEYGNGLAAEADAALATFVANGGGLVRTEWSVWAGVVNPKTDPLMPVSYAGNYKYAPEWNVMLPDHPLVAGVPSVWYDTNGYSHARPHPNATVVMQSEGAWPLLSYRSDTGGKVVHVNHDLTFKGTEIHPNAIRLFLNAVAFAAPTAGP